MRENLGEVRGRNSFFGLIVFLFSVGWIGAKFTGNDAPILSGSGSGMLSKGPAQSPASEQIGDKIGALELVRDYRLRLSDSYRFNTILTFAQPINIEGVARFFEFQSSEDERVPAKVQLVGAEVPAIGAEVQSVGAKGEKLRVTPDQLLEGGKDWRLVLKAGLPSADGRFQFPKDQVWSLGQRSRMRVTGAYAENRLNSDRAIHVDFSQALQSDLKPDDLARWFVLERKVLDGYSPVKVSYSIQSRWRGLTLSGAFTLNTPYRLRVKSGLPSSLGLRLKDEWEQVVRLKPLPGRVYLADTATSQALFGNRSFGFVSVNNRSVRLRVKRVVPGRVFPLLQAYYREYLGRSAFQWSGNTWKQRISQSISYELVPGREVFSKIYPVRGMTDEAVKREFNWDDLLQDAGSGTLFVNIESMGVDGSASAAQSVVQLTDIGLVWKESQGDTFLHAFSLRSAQPLSQAQLRIVSESGEEMAQTHTDVSGNAMLKIKRAGESLWVQATTMGDQHLFQLGSGFASIPLWSFGIDVWRARQGKEKIHLFTDRLVYQPGESVYLKGHVRHWKNGQLEVPPLTDYDVRLTGPRQRVYLQQKIRPDASGALDLEVQLPAGVHGAFEIEVGSEHVYVDALEYEPATFKVKSDSSRVFGPVDPIRVPVSSGYYFGKPLSGAKLRWSLNAHTERPRLRRWEEYHFGVAREHAQASFSGETVLDSEGRTVIEPKLPDFREGPTTGTLFVHLTDVSGQTVTEHFPLIRHSSDYYLGVRELPSIQRIGKPLNLKAVAVRPDGGTHSVEVPVKAVLSRIEWHSVKIKGAGGGVKYQNERRFIPVGTARFKTVAREANGIQTELRPLMAGQYRLAVSAQDEDGCSVVTELDFYVSGKQSLAWDYWNEFKMDLVPDREVYTVSETARILLKAPFSGRALVTVEREKVMRTFQIYLKGNAPVIEVPLAGLDVPNVFVSVLLLRGSAESKRQIKSVEYRLGYCELKVEAPNSRLQVIPDLARSSIRPGEEVEVAVHVSTNDGAAVANAGVTLYAVDEGVLDLTGYRAPDLHSFFYEPKPLDVSTSSTIPFMRTEDPRQVHFGNKGHVIGGGGDGVMRRNFQAVAFWSADMITDNFGNIRTRFIAPDSLTRYRVFAVAHTARQFGTGEAGFQVHLPLMVESALPRFGRVGDQLVAKAMVHNQTAVHRTVLVTLETDDLVQSMGEMSRSVTIPARSTIPVRFPLKFVRVGRARTVWRVRVNGERLLSDSRESWTDIRHVAPLRKAVHFIRASGNVPDLLMDLDSDMREGQGEIKVSVSNSSMAEMGAAAEYLLDYPHGCAEQTSSRLLPWLLLEEYRDLMPRLNLKPDAKKGDAVEHGINRLLSMQTHTGGLAYWPGASADDFASGYAGMVLAVAKRKGKAVPQAALDRLGKYLVQLVKRPVSGNREWGIHCLALYTLALMDRSMPAYHEHAFAARSQMPSDALSLLTAAVAVAGNSEDMLGALRKTEGKSAQSFDYYGNVSQQVAMRLLAMGPGPEAVSLAVRLSQSAREGHWGSTFANAWVILAMTCFDQRNTEGGHVEGVVEFAGTQQVVSLNDSKRMTVMHLTNQPGPMELRRSDGGTQPIFVRVNASVRSKTDHKTKVSKGMSVERVYEQVQPDDAPAGRHTLRVGDLVRVRIKLNVLKDEVRYLALEDGLPASLEPVFGDLKSQQTQLNPRHNWFIDHYELRKDRAVFYVNYLCKGVHRFEYLARVRAEGVVSVPPVKAEAMYNPDIVALSNGATMTTQSLHD